MAPKDEDKLTVPVYKSGDDGTAVEKLVRNLSASNADVVNGLKSPLVND